MRVGLDVSQTGQPHQGCGAFAAALAGGLARLAGGPELVLYPVFGSDFWDPGYERTLALPGVPRRVLAGSHAEAKRVFGQPGADFESRLGDVDLVHSNNFFCPRGLRRARLVYTLYDLIALDQPEWLGEENRAVCSHGLVEASLRADGIAAISAASRERFLAIFPYYPSERLAVVQPADRLRDCRPRPPCGPDLPPGGFWLSVGSFEPRKNWPLLLRAYARLRAERGEPGPLVLVGDCGGDATAAARLAPFGLDGHVRALGHVDDDVLAWLYAHCRALVYPSLGEGFGLPVLEAMGAGAPVVTSNLSSLPEAGEEAALLVDPRDHEALLAALRRLLDEPPLRARLAGLGRARAARSSWEGAAGELLRLYEATLGLPPWAPRAPEADPA